MYYLLEILLTHSPFNLGGRPSMLGMGFRLALALLMRGTPWLTRGSFMSAGSSFAGTGSADVSGC